MRRRTVLALAGTTAGLPLSGCTLPGGGEADTATPTVATTPPPSPTQTPSAGRSLPDGVYVQKFYEEMAMQGTATAGGYAAGVMYAAPHAFWNVVGDDLEKTPRGGDLHLMAVVWDPETNTVLPETGVSVEIEREGELVSQEVIYPMLSQRMGFHWGGNFTLSGDGTYTCKVSVGGANVRRTGSFAGRFGEAATVPVEFEFTEAERAKVSSRKLDQYGEEGAVEPMDTGMMPQAYAPTTEDLPGRALPETRSDDAVFVSRLLAGDAAARFDADSYLAVSARTPYNRIVLPAMALSATVTRDGSTAFEGPLQRTLDPEVGYHYGAAVEGGLQTGDAVTLRTQTPPQVARHRGYERAFLQMDDARFTV